MQEQMKGDQNRSYLSKNNYRRGLKYKLYVKIIGAQIKIIPVKYDSTLGKINH